jgi:guanosine-3',5'-bis(diphosphate) 3'-pyrophosphohydrolase
LFILAFDNALQMEIDKLLSEIKAFADEAHGEQKRKYTGDRYIVHPVRVMELCHQHTSDISILAAALLHDVLEDTPVSREEIHRFLSGLMNTAQASRTLHLVEELTDEYVKAKYPNFNRRLRKAKEVARMEKTSADAQTIKYADIIDNAREIASHDPAFGRVFIRECDALLKNMNKGNSQLFTMAQETLRKTSEELRMKK